MSTGKIRFQSFEEIENRLKEEFGLKKDRQLIDILEVPQPTYSSRKLKNNFSAEWVILLSIKYKLHVQWILTGEGPKSLEGLKGNNESINITDNYLSEVEGWLKDIISRDSRKKGWFEVQFEKAFPEFTYWRKRQESGERENTLFQNVA